MQFETFLWKKFEKKKTNNYPQNQEKFKGPMKAILRKVCLRPKELLVWVEDQYAHGV